VSRVLALAVLLLAIACEAKAPAPPPPPAAPPVAPPVAPPPDAQALFDEGQAAMGKNELDLAVSTFERCVAADPAHPLCHRSLGLLFDHRGDAVKACTHYRRYLELMPTAGDAAELSKRLGSCK
jgi:tetratricopeptide (TPR) repeat protein